MTMLLPRGRAHSIIKQPASASMAALREAIRGPEEKSIGLTFNSILFSFRGGSEGNAWKKEIKDTKSRVI